MATPPPPLPLFADLGSLAFTSPTQYYYLTFFILEIISILCSILFLKRVRYRLSKIEVWLSIQPWSFVHHDTHRKVVLSLVLLAVTSPVWILAAWILLSIIYLEYVKAIFFSLTGSLLIIIIFGLLHWQSGAYRISKLSLVLFIICNVLLLGLLGFIWGYLRRDVSTASYPPGGSPSITPSLGPSVGPSPSTDVATSNYTPIGLLCLSVNMMLMIQVLFSILGREVLDFSQLIEIKQQAIHSNSNSNQASNSDADHSNNLSLLLTKPLSSMSLSSDTETASSTSSSTHPSSTFASNISTVVYLVTISILYTVALSMLGVFVYFQGTGALLNCLAIVIADIIVLQLFINGGIQTIHNHIVYILALYSVRVIVLVLAADWMQVHAYILCLLGIIVDIQCSLRFFQTPMLTLSTVSTDNDGDHGRQSLPRHHTSVTSTARDIRPWSQLTFTQKLRHPVVAFILILIWGAIVCGYALFSHSSHLGTITACYFLVIIFFCVFSMVVHGNERGWRVTTTSVVLLSVIEVLVIVGALYGFLNHIHDELGLINYIFIPNVILSFCAWLSRFYLSNFILFKSSIDRHPSNLSFCHYFYLTLTRKKHEKIGFSSSEIRLFILSVILVMVIILHAVFLTMFTNYIFIYGILYVYFIIIITSFLVLLFKSTVLQCLSPSPHVFDITVAVLVALMIIFNVIYSSLQQQYYTYIILVSLILCFLLFFALCIIRFSISNARNSFIFNIRMKALFLLTICIILSPFVLVNVDIWSWYLSIIVYGIVFCIWLYYIYRSVALPLSKITNKDIIRIVILFCLLIGCCIYISITFQSNYYGFSVLFLTIILLMWSTEVFLMLRRSGNKIGILYTRDSIFPVFKQYNNRSDSSEASDSSISSGKIDGEATEDGVVHRSSRGTAFALLATFLLLIYGLIAGIVLYNIDVGTIITSNALIILHFQIGLRRQDAFIVMTGLARYISCDVIDMARRRALSSQFSAVRDYNISSSSSAIQTHQQSTTDERRETILDKGSSKNRLSEVFLDVNERFSRTEYYDELLLCKDIKKRKNKLIKLLKQYKKDHEKKNSLGTPLLLFDHGSNNNNKYVDTNCRPVSPMSIGSPTNIDMDNVEDGDNDDYDNTDVSTESLSIRYDSEFDILRAIHQLDDLFLRMREEELRFLAHFQLIVMLDARTKEAVDSMTRSHRGKRLIKYAHKLSLTSTPSVLPSSSNFENLILMNTTIDVDLWLKQQALIIKNYSTSYKNDLVLQCQKKKILTNIKNLYNNNNNNNDNNRLSHTDLTHVFIIQRAFRLFVYNLKNKNAIRKISIRRRVLNELLSTERTYIHRLLIIINNFLIPLRRMATSSSFTIISLKDIQSIFGNCELLFKSCCNNLYNMEIECINDGVSGVAKIFNTSFNTLLPMYSDYVNNFVVSLSTLSSCKLLVAFRSFLNDAEQSLASSGVGTLEELLYQPITRLPRYQLLLLEIYKQTPTDHIHRSLLLQSIEKVKSFNDFVNIKKREADKFCELIRVIETLAGSQSILNFITIPGRTYLRKGFLRLDRYESAGSSHVEKSIEVGITTGLWYSVVVCHDLVILCRRVILRIACERTTFQQEIIVSHIPFVLSSIEKINQDCGNAASYEFQLVSADNMCLRVTAQSTSDVDEWIKTMNTKLMKK